MNSGSIVQRLRKYCHVLLADSELAASRTASLREFCVNQLCTVLHGDANQSNGRPGNSLKYKASGDPTRD